MQIVLRYFFVAIGCSTILLLAKDAGAAEFMPIGFLNPGNNYSQVSGLSADGISAVGESYEIGPRADGLGDEIRNGALIRWTVESGISRLVNPSSSDFSGVIEQNDRSFISAVSGDGRSILYDRQTYEPLWPDGPFGAFNDRHFWSTTGMVVSQPLLVDAYVFWHGLSHDGTKRVGSVGGDIYRVGRPNSIAVIEENDGRLTYLGRLPADTSVDPISKATAISTNGLVVVGHSTSHNTPTPSQPIIGEVVVPIGEAHITPPFFLQQGVFEAFVWQEPVGMIGLGDLPGGIFESRATGVSGNGQFIIGTSSVDHGREGFLWTTDRGMRGLGFLNSEYRYSTPSAVSDTGILVGTSMISREIIGYYALGEMSTDIPIYEYTNAAFIWDVEHGMRDLKNVLEQEYGLDLSGWQLTSAVDISDDGRTIAGNGINPQGQYEGWVVRLHAIPEPSAIQLLLISLAAIVWRRYLAS